MPSPFPGMDPYIESPELWSDFHHNLASEIQAHLNRHLQPRYFAWRSAEHMVYAQTSVFGTSSLRRLRRQPARQQSQQRQWKAWWLWRSPSPAGFAVR